MGARSPEVDAYIGRAPDFARPILEHIRDVVHSACPEAEEALKWSHPTFVHQGILCGMGAFKAHCVFGFWKGGLIEARGGGTVEGRIGKITTLEDLPPREELQEYVRAAVLLNEKGVKAPRAAKRKPEIKVPEDLREALSRNAAAAATFEGFSPSQRREYLEWITEAKRSETRSSRIAQAVEWMAEGKPRNWKYMKRPG